VLITTHSHMVSHLKALVVQIVHENFPLLSLLATFVVIMIPKKEKETRTSINMRARDKWS
jgi:hypothetical protein